MLQLTVQETSASASSSSRSRILLSVASIRSLKLQTGGPVLVSNGSGHAVGTVWPSFSVEGNGIQLPTTLQTHLPFHTGDIVDIFALTGKTKPSHATTLQLSLDQQPNKLSPTDRQMLSVFSKEILVDLECVYLGQKLSLAFQGHQYEMRVASFPETSFGEGGTVTPCFVSRSTDVTISKKTNNTDPLSPKSTQERAQAAYSQLGGLDKQIQEIRTLVEMPLTRPEIFREYGLKPPKGVLLFGPPGTGKTSLARAVAASTGASYLTINGPELSSAFHGETEGKLREAFAEAKRKSPCVIIIDEIDALAPRREGGSGDCGNADGAGEVERRVVAQLLTLLDGMEQDGGVDEEDSDDEEERKAKGSPRVVVLAATNRPNAIDPALRRPGRLDREIEIGIPSADSRNSILQTLLRQVPHSLTSEQISDLASRTHGYVGADLSALVREAGMKAVRRAFSSDLHEKLSSLSLSSRSLTYDDFYSALPLVRPSAMREIFLEPPKVYWSDIASSSSPSLGGGLSTKSVQSQVRELVEWPLKHFSAFQRLGVSPPRGVLLYGPPGCSKTLIARALATESGLNFIAVKGPELYSKYIGESERAVREVFKKARAASPSIVFFDEIDALTTTRGSDGGPGDRVIASLLNEMDGIEALSNVVIVAATNRPEIIDPALLRPGRLDRLLYVGPPDEAARRRILAKRSEKMSIDITVDLDEIARMTHGCSGAEVVSVCQEAGLIAMNEDINTTAIQQAHLVQAASSVKRRITSSMLRSYESWRDALIV